MHSTIKWPYYVNFHPQGSSHFSLRRAENYSASSSPSSSPATTSSNNITNQFTDSNNIISEFSNASNNNNSYNSNITDEFSSSDSNNTTNNDNNTEPHDFTKDAEIFLTIEQVEQIKLMMTDPEEGKRRLKRKVEQFDAYVQKWSLPIKYKFDPQNAHGEYCALSEHHFY